MKSKSLFLVLLLSFSTITAQEKPAGKFTGYMFGDYFYNVARDPSVSTLSNTANGGAKDLNGIQFRRIYFTYDNEISSTFSARFRIEGISTLAAPIIKDAYLRWKNIFNGSDLLFGLQPTPAFEISEGVWGYRSLEKTILDLRSIVSSRDVAVSVKGKLDESAMVKYWLMFGNNSGTGAESDKYKRLYAHIQLAPSERISLTVYGDYKMQPSVNDLKSASTPKATLDHNVLTTAVFAGYTEKDMFKFGAEGFLQTTPNDYKDGSPDSLVGRNAVGLSLFGSFNLSNELSLLGRFDLFDPNSNSKAKGDSRNYFILGADWKADKNVSIIPNILYETYEEIGGRSIDASLTARITFFYTFL